jgi:hypothetical protein
VEKEGMGWDFVTKTGGCEVDLKATLRARVSEEGWGGQIVMDLQWQIVMDLQFLQWRTRVMSWTYH